MAKFLHFLNAKITFYCVYILQISYPITCQESLWLFPVLEIVNKATINTWAARAFSDELLTFFG